MKINPYIFRNYDIRAKVPEDLDAAKAEAIGRAYGTFLRKRNIPVAVVGHDCRLSGPEFSQAYINGLVETGINVINIGMVMTQMAYCAQYYFKTRGGTMITASHNPANYNGFKMAVNYSETTLPDDVKEIKNTVETENFFAPREKGKIIQEDIKEKYAEDLLGRIKLSKKFKIIADFRHGTPGVFAPDILRRAGNEVIERRSDPDGSFPAGTPDPTDEKFMRELGREVVKAKADLGLAFDGDGDRVGIVDEQGNISWNDILVAIFAQEILEKTPGAKIVFNTLSSQIVPWVIKKNGGVPIMWLVGHSFIKEKIASSGAAFGGELSGHFFFKDGFYGHDDGVYAALRLLKYLEEKNKTLSEICESFPKYISSPEIKIGCPDDKKVEVIRTLAEKFKQDFPGGKITDARDIPGNDGARIDFEDGMMIFRYSQNGPYITVRFEAKDEEAYNKRKKYAREILEAYSEMIWQDELCVNLDALR
ncbi:MAG: phosphomannomutase/phosphoglucomutase [Patescibacteria group bacterium]|nr:phosphomannomutase/phosphoglucomutase [Patescibacteria group bacterium]